VGPSRCGKTSNFLIPSLYHSIKSEAKPLIIATDPKHELANLTSKFAANNGYKVIIFGKNKSH
jgi:type IV secretory pathway TraG/TraD family ATPase VirD4